MCTYIAVFPSLPEETITHENCSLCVQERARKRAQLTDRAAYLARSTVCVGRNKKTMNGFAHSLFIDFVQFMREDDLARS
ncbi:hypothetical protein KSC_085910 [Ktedonobacter sp. SOSP1-52]|nr:hypothetical protein KSC_085910 [Ktedonobacter sp. SOSP1-52]